MHCTRFFLVVLAIVLTSSLTGSLYFLIRIRKLILKILCTGAFFGKKKEERKDDADVMFDAGLANIKKTGKLIIF